MTSKIRSQDNTTAHLWVVCKSGLDICVYHEYKLRSTDHLFVVITFDILQKVLLAVVSARAESVASQN